jgi:hypothetical protein
MGSPDLPLPHEQVPRLAEVLQHSPWKWVVEAFNARDITVDVADERLNLLHHASRSVPMPVAGAVFADVLKRLCPDSSDDRANQSAARR